MDDKNVFVCCNYETAFTPKMPVSGWTLITISNDLAKQLPALYDLVNKDYQDDWNKQDKAEKLKPMIEQSIILAKEYDCVAANPPYMGGKGMNQTLKDYAKKAFPNSKSNLFAMFIEREFDWCKETGFNSMVTMQSWMFLSSFEGLREELIQNKTIITMAHLGARAFGEISGEVVQTTVFVMRNKHVFNFRPVFFRLVDGQEEQKETALRSGQNGFNNTLQDDFKKIPGTPVAYWVNRKIFDLFSDCEQLGKVADTRVGLQTSNNERFLRYWHEVSIDNIFRTARSREDALKSTKKWFPCNKGGEFRKWYGNHEYVVNWENDGQEIREFRDENGRLLSRPQNMDYYFQEAISWSDVTSSANSFRYFPMGFINDATGHSAFGGDFTWKMCLMAYCNNKFVNKISKILNPTIHFHIGYFNKLPFAKLVWNKDVADKSKACLDCTKIDWDSYEISWDYASFPLLQSNYNLFLLKTAYTQIRDQWQDMTLKMQQLEEENNHIFIGAYGLQDELTPDVPLNEITLTCNPYYRYGGDKSKEVLEKLLQADTLKELISYSIGCMMGRYSLDEPGLIYANSNNIGFEPNRYKTFPADDDGIIPITDMPWFDDDATNRFMYFIKVAWPEEYLEENLKFVAGNLDPKANEVPADTIRRYLDTNFFKDHLKTYKRRPIYWLFSSGKYKAFECLVYLHRYNESTLSRMRSSYVIPLQGKISSRIEFLKQEKDATASTVAKRKLNKEMDLLIKKQAELKTFDEELRHYADQKISLDLDDGVKVNYAKFGNLLAEVKAVTGKE